jgi:hypothetical protein
VGRKLREGVRGVAVTKQSLAQRRHVGLLGLKVPLLLGDVVSVLRGIRNLRI